MKKLYNLTCLIYNFFSTYFEQVFFRKFIVNKNYSNLSLFGYEIIKLSENFDVSEPEKVVKINSFMTKDIISENDIYKYLNSFFNFHKLKTIITEKTGYNYSVDYIISYTTFKIPEISLNKEIYANQWHTDKPFSKNTLKVIIPLNFYNYYNGGIKIFNLSQTLKLKKKHSNLSNEEYLKLNNKEGEIFIFYPNLCFHKAGNPNASDGRKQIMMQLNPSKNWCFNKNLYKKQFKIEPKFPFFSYLRDKKSLL